MIYYEKHNTPIEIYDDEFITFCPNCGKKIHLTPQLVHSLEDFATTSVYCKKCCKSHLEEEISTDKKKISRLSKAIEQYNASLKEVQEAVKEAY